MVAQAGEVARPGSMPSAMEILCTSCEARISAPSTSQVFRILPRSGRMAWNSRSRACLARTAGGVALDQEQFGARRVLRRAVGQLAGQRGAGGDLLAQRPGGRPQAAGGAADDQFGELLASSVCWFSHRLKASLRDARHKRGASRDDRRSLVWPENCGSRSLADST